MALLHLQLSTSIRGISSSHPNQNWLEQAISVHNVVSRWDWAYQGHIKTHSGCACWSNGVMVLTQIWVWRVWLVLLCHGAILLLCRGHESMSGTYYLSVSICTVYLLDLLNPLLCHLPRRKTCHVKTICVLQSIRLLWEADLLQHC